MWRLEHLWGGSGLAGHGAYFTSVELSGQVRKGQVHTGAVEVQISGSFEVIPTLDEPQMRAGSGGISAARMATVVPHTRGESGQEWVAHGETSQRQSKPVAISIELSGSQWTCRRILSGVLLPEELLYEEGRHSRRTKGSGKHAHLDPMAVGNAHPPAAPRRAEVTHGAFDVGGAHAGRRFKETRWKNSLSRKSRGESRSSGESGRPEEATGQERHQGRETRSFTTEGNIEQAKAAPLVFPKEATVNSVQPLLKRLALRSRGGLSSGCTCGSGSSEQGFDFQANQNMLREALEANNAPPAEMDEVDMSGFEATSASVGDVDIYSCMDDLDTLHFRRCCHQTNFRRADGRQLSQWGRLHATGDLQRLARCWAFGCCPRHEAHRNAPALRIQVQCAGRTGLVCTVSLATTVYPKVPNVCPRLPGLGTSQLNGWAREGR